MPKEYPIGTIREWQKGTVIKAHPPMDPFSSGWILLKTSPELEQIGRNCDSVVGGIKGYDLPINGEKFLDHEIDEFTDENGEKIFTADSFKQYWGFYGAGRYAFRNEFSRLFMQNDMRLKEEINSSLVMANEAKGGDRKTVVLTDEEKKEIRDRIKAEFRESDNRFTAEKANQLYEIVKRVKAQLEEGVDFKDPERKAAYEAFIAAADTLPAEYDKIKVKRELKNRMMEIIEEKFSDNWGVRESCKDYMNKRFQEYVRKYADQISNDALDEQIERFGVTIDMEPDEFYQRIYDKVDGELDKDDGSFKDLMYLRFMKRYNKAVEGDWALEHLPALHNLENAILELPEGHFLTNDMVNLITNKDYKGGSHGGYAWYDWTDRRINFSANCIDRGTVFGVLANPNEFRATLFHEIGHAVSKKLGRENFYDYRKFVVECGWTYQSPELRAGVKATGDDRDIPRTGSNGNIKLITPYAHKSPEEAFAEYYSFYNLQKENIDKFLDTGNENFLRKNTVSQIDSAEGVLVGASGVYNRVLDLNEPSSLEVYEKYQRTVSGLSKMYPATKMELISPWQTSLSQSEVQKFEPATLRKRKDWDIANMPPTVSYAKDGKNVIIDGATRVEAARMNKRAVPTITLSHELYQTLKDKGWSDTKIADCAYTQHRSDKTPYQKKSEVKVHGMTYRHIFVPFDVLKENTDVFRAMRKVYNSQELQKAIRELFEKGVGDGVSRNMSPNEIADYHGVPIKDIITQLEVGVKIEMEHTTDKQEAKRIALDHLYEFPDYYTRLEIMEKQAEEGVPVHKIEIKKSGSGVLTIFTDVIKKARAGRYVDNGENRKLGRVGMTYGQYQIKLDDERENRVKERSKNLTPIYEKVSKRIEEGLRKAGYEVKYISKSSTRYGKSWYLKLDDDIINGDQIRISDHPVGERRYINDNTVSYIDYKISDEELEERIGYIVRYLKKKDEKRKELEVIWDRRHQEFEEFSLRRDMVYGELEEQGLGISTVDRTYQDIDVVKYKHPDWSNIFQEKLSGGAFKYSYTKPKDSYTSKGKMSKEYLNYLEETFLKKSFMVNDILGITGSVVNLVNSFTEDELIIKARAGRYADTSENRRLKRVGQQYGSKKEEEQGKSKTKGEDKKKEIDEYTDDDLTDFARASTDENLQRSAVGSNERLRVIAKKELERRKSEGLEGGETPDEDNVEKEKEKSEKKSDVKKKPNLEEKIDHFFDKLNDEYIIDYKSKDKSIFRRFVTNVPEDFLDTFFFLNTVGDLLNNLPESLVKELSETFVDLAPEDVYKSLSGGYWVAAYNEDYDKIDINENLYNTIVGGGGYYESDQYRKVLLHEYGHKMYRKGLIDEEIIFKLWRNKERVSSQAKIDHEENFCEAFAAFLMASGSERSLEDNRDLKDFYEEFPLTFTIFKTLIDQLNEEQAN